MKITAMDDSIKYTVNWAPDVCAVRIRIQEGWESIFVKDLYDKFSIAQMGALNGVLAKWGMPILSTYSGQELLDTKYDLDCWKARLADIAHGMFDMMYAVLKLHAEGHWPVHAHQQNLKHPCVPGECIRAYTLYNLSVGMDMKLVRDIVVACDRLPNLSIQGVGCDDREWWKDGE